MTSRYIAMAAIASALFAIPAVAQEMKAKPAGDAAPMMTLDRETFLETVASSNAFEIQSSELAEESAKDDRLKQAAKVIIADHRKAGEKLKAMLEGKGTTPPAETLNPKHQKMLDQLSAAKGADFDILYLDMQAQAHMEAVALFRTYAGSGEDQSLVGFAKETLPALESHLAHVTMLVMKHSH
jgi:putative membrane protein